MSVVATDVEAVHRLIAPAPLWPTVAALNRPGVTNWSQFGQSMLPQFTPAGADVQPAEKQGLPTTVVKVDFVDAPVATYGNTVDLSLQARRAARSQEPFEEILSAATARETNRYVLGLLRTAATGPHASLSAAIRSVAGFGGPILVITSALEGAADLAVAAASGRLRVIADPDAADTMAVALVAVALEVTGVGRLDAPNVAAHGVDIATYATVVGPVCAPGSVAVGELQLGGGGVAEMTWADV